MASIETGSYHVKVTFVTPVLGTQPQRDVATDYLAGKFEAGAGSLPDDELETLPEQLQKGTTAFHKVDGCPVMYDYMVKGFLKEAGRIFNGLDGVKALQSKIDNLVFVRQRRIPLHVPDGAEITFLERPLRAQTAQGPRVGLARSEMLPEGTWFEFDLDVYNGQVSGDILRALLSYGERKGLGQWRNGGWGRITFEFS
jgi:hypothetical protein